MKQADAKTQGNRDEIEKGQGNLPLSRICRKKPDHAGFFPMRGRYISIRSRFPIHRREAEG